jgi:hypothetical protein
MYTDSKFEEAARKRKLLALGIAIMVHLSIIAALTLTGKSPEDSTLRQQEHAQKLPQ